MVIQPSSPPSHREAWFGRRVDDHFARLIKHPGELEVPVQTALQGALLPEETLLWIVFAPYQGVLATHKIQQRRSKVLPWEFTPDCVLALSASRLLLVQIAETESAPEVISIPLQNILSLQNGTVLLLSWFEVCWAENGAPRRQKIYYNAVCECFFVQLTTLIRASWPVAPGNECEGCSLDVLPFKFKNLLRLRVFSSGQPAQRVLFRPSLWQSHHMLLRRMIAPRMALAVNGSCLAVAEEDMTGRDGSYGFIFTLLPLATIQKIAVIPAAPHLALRISLTHQGANLELALPFPPQMATALETWACLPLL